MRKQVPKQSEVKLKRCGRCHEWKEANAINFPRNRNLVDGLFGTCRECINLRSREYTQRHADKLKRGEPPRPYDNTWRDAHRKTPPKPKSNKPAPNVRDGHFDARLEIERLRDEVSRLTQALEMTAKLKRKSKRKAGVARHEDKPDTN